MKREDFIINIHHIGGVGDCGPVDVLVSFKDEAEWFLYDADNTSLNDLIVGEKNATLINKCIGGKDGKAKFYITKDPAASSLFKCANKAKNYIIVDDTMTWGERTEIVKEIEIEMTKLSTLIKNKVISGIDFLSVDAQAADLDIIKGCDEYQDDIVGILCEVEFERLYENQPLFFDVHKYLHDRNFRLACFYNPQLVRHSTYSKANKGKGFITVGEMVFLRNPDQYYKMLKSKKKRDYAIAKLLKLAMISIAYAQIELSKEIVEEVSKYVDLEKLGKDTGIRYVEAMYQLHIDNLKTKEVCIRGGVVQE